MAPISIFSGRSATRTSRVKAEFCTPTPAYGYPIPRISKIPRNSAGVYYYNQSQALEIVPWGTEYKVYAFNQETDGNIKLDFPTVRFYCFACKMLAKLRNLPLFQDLNWRLAAVGLTSSLGAVGFGFDNGWWGGALGLSEFKHKYGAYDAELDAWALPSQKTSVGTGTGSAGIILGCLMAPIITSKFGRKAGFLALSLLMIVGVILEASAITSFWQLVVGRIIVYSGIGLASNVVPTYLSECAPTRVRGL